MTSSSSFSGDNWPSALVGRTGKGGDWGRETRHQLRERVSRKLMCIRPTHITRIWHGNRHQRSVGWWKSLFYWILVVTLTPHSDKCVSEQEPLGNLGIHHGFLDSNLEKMLADTPWCNRVWYLRRSRWEKVSSAPGEGWVQGEAAMGMTNSGERAAVFGFT